MPEIFSNLWLNWIFAALAFAIGEMVVPYFGLIFATFGSLVAAGMAYAGYPWAHQVLSFTVALILGLFLLRPRLVKKLQSRHDLPTRTGHLIGKKARVIETIDSVSGKGR